MSAKTPIGILGGTFDPIHFGHLRCALELCQILQLQEVRLLPCKQPVHKNGVHASAKQRLAMLELAVAASTKLVVDPQEIERDTPSYIVETLENTRKALPEHPLCLIVGTDAFMQIPTWHRWEQILHLTHIVVATRPGYELVAEPEVANMLDSHEVHDFVDLHQTTHGNVYIQAITPLDIKATSIRQLVAANYDPSYLLPHNVLKYIKTHDIYSK